LKFFRYTYIILFFLIAVHASGQKYEQKLPEKTRLLFLLDGSGSMLAKWGGGGQTRMDAAKKILGDIVDSLASNSKVELALRVYGHQFHKQQNVCNDTKLEVPFSQRNHKLIISKLNAINPKGNTPITFALEKAADDFPVDNTYRNIIILITDGIESCDGDPCSTSLALQKKDIFLKPFIIGLGMTMADSKQFDCVGKFIDAKNRKDLHNALNESIHQSLDKTTATVELLTAKGGKTVSNINVTFINNFTGLAAYEFIHYRNKFGRPDTVEIDGILNYDVIVNTVPPVVLKNVAIKSGEHNTISVKAPQGGLELKQSGSKAYGKEIQVLVKNRKTGNVINTQPINRKHNYLTGNYDVEVLTLPRTILKNIRIEENKTTSLSIKSPGFVNLKMTASGYGSLYYIHNSGRQEWVYNINEKLSTEKVVLQPGKYKVVFRAKNAPGSKFTSIKTFEIKSGSSINLTLFN